MVTALSFFSDLLPAAHEINKRIMVKMRKNSVLIFKVPSFVKEISKKAIYRSPDYSDVKKRLHGSSLF
jgi:hypothetical protein